MGMTIDNAKQLLSQYQKLFNSLNGDYKLSQVQISELSHSISTALDTMRKYQKIKNIICKWEDGLYDDEALLDCEVLEKISDEINGSGENADASNNN